MSYRTELSSQEKGKILAYMENFNPAEIERKIRRDPTTICRFIDKYKKIEKLKIYCGQDGHLFLIIMRKMHLLVKLQRTDVNLYMKLLIN